MWLGFYHNLQTFIFVQIKRLFKHKQLLLPSLNTLLGHKLTWASSGKVICHNAAWLDFDYVCWFNLNYPSRSVNIFCWLPTYITIRLWVQASFATFGVALRLLMIISLHLGLFRVWYVVCVCNGRFIDKSLQVVSSDDFPNLQSFLFPKAFCVLKWLN